ncbi:MAG: TVP38/TMEM64 family protein [Myxococcota bacterium]
MLLAGVLVGLACGVGLQWSHGLPRTPDELRAALAGLGAIGPALFVAAVALRPLLLLPSWVLLAVGGLLFGTLWGTLFSSLGMWTGALATYAIARFVGREALEAREKGALARFDHYLGLHGAPWLAAWVALPVSPLTPAFVASGLSSLTPLRFASACALGVVPRCALYSFFAASLASGDRHQIVMASGALAAALALGAWAGRRWLFATRASHPPAV